MHKTNQLLHRTIKLTDDILYSQHGTQCKLTIQYCFGYKESNQDIFTSPLQGLPNVILTPHIGGSTVEAQEAIGLDVAEKLIAFTDTGSSIGSLTVPDMGLPVLNNAHRLLHIHHNVPGVLSSINGVLSKMNVNILGQYLKTNEKIGYVVLDIDKKNSPKVIAAIDKVKHTIRTRSLY